MRDLFVFTEIINCGPVGRIMLESYHRHHNYPITVYTTAADFEQLGEIGKHENNNIVLVYAKTYEKFSVGHSGTADVFAHVFQSYPERSIIHIDSDIFFKKESLSLIDHAFIEGYDIAGSRRCYKNNPAHIKVPEHLPDTISTYFFGMKTKVLPDKDRYTWSQLCELWGGNPIGLDHMVFDFGDPVIFHALKKGAQIKFIDSELIGGQNVQGSKVNSFTSNLHLDMGEYLAHFGGCGTGYAVAHNLSHPPGAYAEWAVHRWNLFQKIFYNKEIAFSNSTKFDEAGRWISGSHNDMIIAQIKNDLNMQL